jgi:toxin FitB
MTTGRRRSRLNEAFERTVNEKLDRRIASFDDASARAAAALMAIRQQHGRTGELRDAMIAGIALAHRAMLATGNSRHFSDLSIPVVNPWESAR